jgi:glycosyltransferase involved in cell wall biosynthesis
MWLFHPSYHSLSFGSSGRTTGSTSDFMQPLLSIITVVRNSPEQLLRTINSIIPFKHELVEYVIIDGASNDATIEVIASHRKFIDVMVSEPDQGIYDAMNKGVTLANGSYVLFLNAGDEQLIDLVQVIKAAPEDAVMIYGRANMVSANGSTDYVKGKQLKSLRRFLKGMPLCHQAILYRRKSILPYDLNFRVISDRVMTYNLLRKYGLKRSYFSNQIFATYYQDGFSSRVSPQFKASEEAHFFRSIGKPHYITLKYINFIFKHSVKRPFLRWLGMKI